MSKDVMWAGAIALGCVMLVAVAVLAPKSKEPEPTPTVTEQPSLTGPEGLGPIDPGFGNPPLNGVSTGPTTGFGTTPGPTTGFGPTTGPTTGFGPTTGNGTTEFGPTPNLNPLPVPMMPEPVVAAAAPVEHVVASGETLGDISLKYFKTSKQWKKIVEANPGLDPRTIKVGQKLVIPVEAKPAVTALGVAPVTAPGERTYTIKANDSLYSVARKELGNGARWKEIETLNSGVNTSDLKVGQVIKLPADVAKTTEATAPEATTGKTHTVAKGETLGDISKKYYGTTQKWKEIAKANPKASPENLKVGQKLVIPEAAGAIALATSGEYTIKAGDTIRAIARTQLGDDKRWKEILDVNPGLNPKGLRAGQVIKLPGEAAKPVVSPIVPEVPAVQPMGNPQQPNQPFGSTSPTAPPFGASTPPFGASAPPAQPFGAQVQAQAQAQAQAQPAFGSAPSQPQPPMGMPSGASTGPSPSDFSAPYPPFGEPAPIR